MEIQLGRFSQPGHPRHLEKGYRVVMEASAAHSIRNDLEEVRSMGIEVAEKPVHGGFEELKIQEVDLPLVKGFLSHFGEEVEVDTIAVSVQDHGVSPAGVSDRLFRFEKMEAMLRKDNRPESFHFSEDSVPSCYLRMQSAVRAVRRAFLASDRRHGYGHLCGARLHG